MIVKNFGIAICFICVINYKAIASEYYLHDEINSGCNSSYKNTIISLQDISSKLNYYFDKSARTSFEFPSKKYQYIEAELKYRINEIIKIIDNTLKNDSISIIGYYTVKKHISFVQETKISYLSSLREIIPEMQKMSNTILCDLHKIYMNSN